MLKKNLIKSFLILFTIFVLSMLIRYPSQMLDASKNGVRLWLNVLLPSLLPFMVGVSILNSLGASRILGTILEPIVKPIFRVSGYGAFPFVMGILSGYPMGAKITQQLLDESKISTIEAQRILSFSNNPGVLFILGTVASGMLSCPIAGYFIILVTVLSAVSSGFCFRFYGYSFVPESLHRNTKHTKTQSKKTGELLGESIKSSMETLTQIGGFVILFSVIIQALYLSGVVNGLSQLINNVLPLEKDAVYGMISGILEITNGANVFSNTQLPLSQKLSLTCCVLSMGGMSILAQTLSILHTKELKTSVYIISKILNGFFAYLYAVLLYPLFSQQIEKTVPAFSAFNVTPAGSFTYSMIVLMLFFLVILWSSVIKHRI